MNPEEIITKVTEERMKHVRMFPGDTMLIEQETKIAVACGIEEALKSVMQDYPPSNRRDNS